MSSFLLPASLRAGRASGRRVRRRGRPGRALVPGWESVEDRTLLSTVTWLHNASGDWDNPANWNTGTLPSSSDDVSIPFAGITVTHSTGDDSVNSLDSKAAVVLSGGSLSVANASTLESSLEVSGTVTLNGPVTISGAFTLDTHASLGGSAAITANGLFTCGDDTAISVASIDAEGGLSATLTAGTTVTGTALTINGSSTLTLSGTGTVSFYSGAAFTNLGSLTVNVAAANTGAFADGDTSASFTNSGSITKKGTGSFSITTNLAVNNGTISVQAGTLVFEDGESGDASTGAFAGSSGTTLQIGGSALASNASITSTGSVILDNNLIDAGLYKVQAPGATTANGQVQITGDLEALGASLTVTASNSIALNPTAGPSTETVGKLNLGSASSLTGTLNITVSGLFTWDSNATTVSVASINAQGGLNYSASGSAVVIGTVLTLKGSSTFSTGAGSINLSSNAQITNSGTIAVDVETGDGYGISGTDGTTQFINAGTITKTGGGPFSITTDSAANNGTIDTRAGTLVFSEGTPGTKSSGTFKGASGTTLELGDFNLDTTSSVVSTGTVEFDGTVSESGLLNVQGPGYTLVAGQVQITGNLQGLGTDLNISPDASLVLSPTAGESKASLDTLTLSNGATLAGTLPLALTGLFTWDSSGTTISIASIDAEGGVNYSASGDAIVTKTKLTINGASQFSSGDGSISLSAGASITNKGSIAVDVATSDGYGITDTDATGSFTNSGTITKTSSGPFTIALNVAINNGTFDVQGGTLKFDDNHGGDASTGSFSGASGTTMFLAGSALGNASSIVSHGLVDLSGGLVAAGNYNVTAPGATNVSGPAQITGDLEALGDSVVVAAKASFIVAPTSGPNKVTISTLTVKTAASLALGKATGHAPARAAAVAPFDSPPGPTVTLIVSTGVTSAGSVTINTGTAISSPTYDQTSGGSTSLNGGTLEGGSLTMDGGDLEGPGTLGDDLINTGPGTLNLVGTGLLTILGTFVQYATGTLDVGLQVGMAGNPDSGIKVEGTVKLDGTLTAHLVGGFQPSPGDEYQVLTFQSATGNFSSEKLTVLGNEQLTAVLGPHSLSLRAPGYATRTQLASSASAIAFGARETLSATVSTVVSGVATPTGSVVFMDGTNTLGTATLINGVASLATTSLGLGAHSITAVYQGNAVDLVSNSNTVKVNVSNAVALTPTAPHTTDSVIATVSGPNVNGSTKFQYAWSDMHGAATTPLVTHTSTSGSDSIDLGSFAISGGDQIICTVTPSDGTTATTAQVQVAGGAPVAQAQSVSVATGGSVTITLSATDSNQKPLTYSIVSAPRGTLTRKSNGVYIYTPTASVKGSDSFTFDASDGTLVSNAATVAITVLLANTAPTANAQTVTLLGTDQAHITLHGADAQTPAAQLIYTITALPGRGTLYESNGTAITVGTKLVGSQAVVTYLAPVEVLGAMATTFAFTVTDIGNPAGSTGNALTSTPAKVTVQTPAGASGVLRIGGTLGNDTVSLSKSASGPSLHVLLNGASAGADVPFSKITTIRVFGQGGNETFSVAAGLSKPVVILGGPGNDTLTAGATNLTFTGGTGKNVAAITTSAGIDFATLRPGTASVAGPGYAVNLSNVASILVHGDSRDTANLFGSNQSDTFTASPSAAMLSTGVSSNTAAGFGKVIATAVAGGSDAANFTTSTGSSTLAAAPTSATLSGAGFSDTAKGFATVVATAPAGASATANLTGSRGNDSFTARPLYAQLSGKGFSLSASGFKTVVAHGGAGGSDAATLTDTAGRAQFVASPASATLAGPGFSSTAQGFGKVVANAAPGGGDSASLFDSPGGDAFIASPTTASLSGHAYSVTVNGFASVIAHATAGRSDWAFVSGGAGTNLFTASPSASTMRGAGYMNQAIGFAVVDAIASSTADSAYLTDGALTGLYLAGDTYGTLTGPGYTIQVAQFGTVTIDGSHSANNRLHRNAALDYALNEIGNWADD
jgi:hypothetical protein